jgi:hypothetical protein
MNTPMNYRRRWRRRQRKGIAEIVGAIFLVALTLVAGIILWSFRIHTPPAPPHVGFVILTGGSNPVWGDPTDDGPKGYSLLNTSAIIISSHSPSDIPLSDIYLMFVCNANFGYATAAQGGTFTNPPTNTIPTNLSAPNVLIQGTLASMTWYPGFGTYPSSGPKLGWCANFDAGGYGGGAFGTFFNRLGLFTPISMGATTLENGDTFILYIHNGGWPLDYAAQCGGSAGHPVADCDDYHGAPPWCFVDTAACTIYLTYTGTPSSLLATIPVTQLAPPS